MSKRIFILNFVVMSMLVFPGFSAATWWDGSWNYRKQVIITNNVETILYDYSMNISLNTAVLISQGNMQSDCGDIRIIEDGEEINYGIRECNSENTEIYFIANDLIVGDNNDIYIYYGNPDANDGFVENWKDAFYIWYDDFDTDRGWYDAWGRGGYYTVSDGYLTVYFSPYTDVAYIPADGSSFPMDGRVGIKTEAKMMVLNNRICQGQIRLAPPGEWPGLSILHLSAGHQDVSVGFSPRFYYPVTEDTWYIAEFVYNRLTGDWRSKLKDEFNVDLELVAGNRPALESDDYSTIIVSGCNNNNPRVDYIYLRYFIEPEPGYSLGEEEYAIIGVDIDVKPQSCPNPLNVKSQGVLPVAILGSPDFDVNSIDVASIRLAGVAPIRSNYKDVAAPVPYANECECTTEGPDGYIDLALKYRTPEIVEELVNTYGELVRGEGLPLTLTGALYDGTPIEGGDCVKIVGKMPKHIAARIADINEDGIVNMLDLAKLAEYWLECNLDPPEVCWE